MRQAFRRTAAVDDPRAALGAWLDGTEPGRLEAQLAPLGPSEAFFLVHALAVDVERRMRVGTTLDAVCVVLGALGGVAAMSGVLLGLALPVLAVAVSFASSRHRRRLGRLLVATVPVLRRLDDPDLLGPLLTLMVRMRAFAVTWREARSLEGPVREGCAAAVRLIEASGRGAWLDGDERAALTTLIADAAHEHLLTVRPALFGDAFLVGALLLAGDLRMKEAAPHVFELPRRSASPQVQEAACEFLRANGLPVPAVRR